jgi:outer membrane protein assembly factor BamB
MKTRMLLLVAVGVSVFTFPAAADDWPQWRGPKRDGISKETGLLTEWPKNGPKLLWQTTDIGSGYSTPAVVGARLYLVSNKGKDNEFVHALAVKDGKEIWTTKLGMVGANIMGANYPGSRSTPTVDGDVLYALGSDGDLVCAKIADGSEIWRKSLRSDFAGKPGKWAYCESPLVDGNVVVCTPGGKDATLVALDKKSGKLLWKSAVPEGDLAAYSSAIVMETGGVKQYVQFLEKGVVGVEAKTGKFLWRYDKTATNSPANIPTPVEHGGYIYTASGKGGAALVKVTVNNEKASADEVYFNEKLPKTIGGSIWLGGYLYGTGAKSMMCVEFTTGVQKWSDPCIGAASLCYADGRFYLHGENGDVALVVATPDGYLETGRFTPPGQPKHLVGPMEKAWAYPVVANGRLYLRDHGVVWCYDVKAGK